MAASRHGWLPLIWLAWTAAIWLFPACMMVIWTYCYAEVYGEPGPYHPWPERSFDLLLGLNCLALILYVRRFAAHNGYLVLALIAAAIELYQVAFVWLIGRAQLSGFWL